MLELRPGGDDADAFDAGGAHQGRQGYRLWLAQEVGDTSPLRNIEEFVQVRGSQVSINDQDAFAGLGEACRNVRCTGGFALAGQRRGDHDHAATWGGVRCGHWPVGVVRLP